MKIKKNILKIIKIGSIFIFSGFNFTYLISLNNSNLSGFWITHNIKTSINQASAEDDENEYEDDSENKNRKTNINTVSSASNNKTSQIKKEEVQTNPILITKIQVNPVQKSSTVIKNTKINSNNSVYINKIQDIGDSTRSINGISGASVVWESSDDKKNISTVKYYKLGKKLRQDFKQNTTNIVPIITTQTPPTPAIIPPNKVNAKPNPVPKPTITIKKPILKPVIVPTPKPTPPVIQSVQTPIPATTSTPMPVSMPVPNTMTKPS